MFKISIWDRQTFKFRWKTVPDFCRFITETTFIIAFVLRFASIRMLWLLCKLYWLMFTKNWKRSVINFVPSFFNISRINKSIRSNNRWLKACQCNLLNISFYEISQLPPLITLAALPWNFWHLDCKVILQFCNTREQ